MAQIPNEEIITLFTRLVGAQSIASNELGRVNQRIDESIVQFKERIDVLAATDKASTDQLKKDIEEIKDSLNALVTQMTLIQHTSPTAQMETLRLQQAEHKSQLDRWSGQLAAAAWFAGAIGLSGLGTAIGAFMKVSGK